MTSTTSNGSSWLKSLAGPLISAILAGGMMYVAVRVELARVASKQEAVKESLDDLKDEVKGNRLEMSNVKERLVAVELAVKK